MNSCSINALTDVSFIPTTEGLKTVRATLLEMHKPGFQISHDIPGFNYSSIHRFLSSNVAVVIQILGISKNPRKVEKLLTSGLPEKVVDTAIERLTPGSMVFDPLSPFMQQPALNLDNPKDDDTYVGRAKHPVKKLLPSMPPDRAEDFWYLFATKEEALDLPTALLTLTMYHFWSLVSNNSYDGRKCVNGSPGMRFVGNGNTATEIVWEGKSLLQSILLMMPTCWAKGHALPAWADRKCKKSQENGSPHPLWTSTWSSNAPAAAWKNETLIGVRTGGIPESWYIPEMGLGDDRKRWRINRDKSDPYYLYRNRDGKNGQSELKLQRLDLGTDATALAVEWAAESNTKALLNWQYPRLINPDLDCHLVFVRHRVEGTSTSPNIRESEIFTPDPKRWSFDVDESILDQITLRAELIKSIHDLTVYPFRPGSKEKKTKDNSKYAIDFLKTLKTDASATFWRQIDSVFVEMLREVRTKSGEEDARQSISPEVRKNLLKASDDAFKEVTEPYYYKNPALISYVRNITRARTRSTINKAFPKSSRTKKEDN